jgi:hypothetical protein
MSEINTDSLIKYGRAVAKEFGARRNRIRNFVTEHNLTSGTANEIILRDFLASLSPGRYTVGQGFICNPTRPNQVSRQCDILVFDQINYPLVHFEGDVKVVWPESVQVVIEVKTRLDRNQLAAAIGNIRAAKQLRTMIMGMIFAFGSSRAGTIIKNLRQYSEGFPMQYAPEVILLLDRKTIFVSTRRMGEKSTYVVRTAKDEGVLVTYLLLRFLDELSSLTGVPKGALFTAAGQVLVNETEIVSRDVRIGSHKL